MKSAINLFILLFVCSLTFGQNNQADTTKKKDQKNNVATQQVQVTPGASGVKRSIGYKFSSSTEAADPGNGVFRFDKGVAADVNYMIVDDIDIKGEDQTKWYSTWDKNTGATGRGRITVADASGKVAAVYDFTSVFIDANGFWKLPVKFVSGSLPSDGIVYYYVFERIAHSNVPATNTQGNQAVVPAVVPAIVATEVAAVTQTNNQVQVAETVPPVVVKDTVKVVQTTQTGQTAVTTTAAVATGAVAVTQAANPPVVPQVNTQGAVQTTQSKPVTQTAPPAQTKPVTQTTPPAQTKPVTQAAATTAAATTVAVQPTQKPQTTQTTQTTQKTQNTQTTQPAQQVQSNQAAPPNNQPPAKQYNNFPEVQNIFSSQGASKSRRKWYRGIIEAGYGFGLGDYGINNFRFNFINAIKIGEFSSIGLGIGYRRLFTDNTSAPYLVSDVNQIPVFLDLRTSFSTRRLTPYLALGIGSSSGSDSSGTEKALLMFNASGGIWYNFSPRFAVFAGIAYEMQKLNFSDTDPFTDSYKKNSGSLSLNIGISF